MATKGAKDSPKEFDSGQTQFLFRDVHSQFPTWSMMPIIYDLGSSNLFIGVADWRAWLCWVCFLFLFIFLSLGMLLYTPIPITKISKHGHEGGLSQGTALVMTWREDTWALALRDSSPPKQTINKQTNEKLKDYRLKTVYLVISLFEGGFLCVLSFKPWSQVFHYRASAGTVGKNKTRRVSLQIAGDEQTALSKRRHTHRRAGKSHHTHQPPFKIYHYEEG